MLDFLLCLRRYVRLLQVSWCKLEVEVATPKNVMMASAENQPQDVPPLVVAALNLKTRFNAQVSSQLSAVDSDSGTKFLPARQFQC